MIDTILSDTREETSNKSWSAGSLSNLGGAVGNIFGEFLHIVLLLYKV